MPPAAPERVPSQPLPTACCSQQREPHSGLQPRRCGPDMTDEERKFGRGSKLLPAASNFILKGRRRKGGTSRQETFPLMGMSRESR